MRPCFSMGSWLRFGSVFFFDVSMIWFRKNLALRDRIESIHCSNQSDEADETVDGSHPGSPVLEERNNRFRRLR